MTRLLEFLFEKTPDGFITIWAKNRPTIWHDLSGIDWQHVKGQVMQLDRAGADVYFSTCPGTIRKAEPYQRIEIKDVHWLPALFMDIDTSASASTAEKKVPASPEQAVKLLQKLKTPPSAIVNSGHGIHAYWRLQEPEAVNADNLERIKNTLKSFAENIAKALGDYTDIDTSASEPARVLRVPGTQNRKGQPVPVELLELSGRDYNLGTLTKTAQQEGERAERHRRELESLPDAIIEGGRNDTLHRLACSLWARKYPEAEVYQLIHEVNRERCIPPLQGNEVNTLTASALKHPPGTSFEQKLQEEAGTSEPPGQPEAPHPVAEEDGLVRFSDDFTEQGNALMFKDAHKARFCYIKGMNWMYWDGMRWQDEALEHTKKAYMALCDRMRREAARSLADAPNGSKEALERYKWAIRSRSEKVMRGSLSMAQSIMLDEAASFDACEYELNTPGGIVDLRTGAIRPHDSSAKCTWITGYAPSNQKPVKWLEHLKMAFDGDEELIQYIQEVAGMAAFGKVYEEAVIIAYGTGENGKSTLFNALRGVFGLYAETIAPEILMTTKNKTEANGLVRVRGKRFILAAETEEGNRLSESTMKRLSSADVISSRSLYKDAISFTPSHTLILQTNHLPKIGSTDLGTWRRIVRVPFGKKVSEARPTIKDYAGVLQSEEGGSIMAWIIEGAVRFWANEKTLSRPHAVTAATLEYQANENWIQNFLQECCERGPGPNFEAKAGELLSRYTRWAKENNETYIRSGNNFAEALRKEGFTRAERKTGNYWQGLRILPEAYENQENTRVLSINY